jgi:hypothetical protein
LNSNEKEEEDRDGDEEEDSYKAGTLDFNGLYMM